MPAAINLRAYPPSSMEDITKMSTYFEICKGLHKNIRFIFYQKDKMGIKNREGSLYMVTGIDNSLVYTKGNARLWELSRLWQAR